MANRIIEVNTAVLKSDINDIQSELQKITGGADQLEQILHQLESMWDGNAKKAFSDAVNDDLRRLRELTKALEKFTGKTGEVRQDYDRCENAVAQIIASIRV